MVGEEFDLNALNTWMSPMDQTSGMLWPLPPYGNDHVDSRHAGIPLQSSMSSTQYDMTQPERRHTVSDIWFNRIAEKTNVGGQSETPTRPASPPLPQSAVETSGVSEVDEVYRLRLSTQMKPKWSEEPLPSTEFLVRSYSEGRNFSTSYKADSLIEPMHSTFLFEV
jgi:hypothetical protein